MRGEAALKARQPKEARKNAAIAPFERSFSDSHWPANFQFRLEEPNLPFEGELMQCARNGNSFLSVRVSSIEEFTEIRERERLTLFLCALTCRSAAN